MPAQDLDADRMEGAHPGHPLHLPQQSRHPLLHLARGLVGKGHCEDFVRACLASGQKMHDPACQRLGLAGPCARQHQHRAIQRQNSGPLCRVQIIQIRHRPRRHCTLRQGNCGLEGL